MSRVRSVIEIGSSKIICLTEKLNHQGMDIPASACVRYDGIIGGKWVNSRSVRESIESAISNAEAKLGTQIRSAYVGVPGCFIKVIAAQGTKHMAAGKVTAEEIDIMQNKLIPQMGSDWFLLEIDPLYFLDDKEDLYINAPFNLRTSRLTACFSFIYASKEFVQEIEGTFNELHIGIERYICEARAQGLRYIPSRERDNCALLLDIGYHTTDLSIVFGDGIMAHSAVFAGGSDIAAELQRILGIDAALAENLKRSHIFGIKAEKGSKTYGKNADGRMVSFDAHLVGSIIEDTSENICKKILEKITKYTKYITRTTPVYLIGGGLAMYGADTFLSMHLERNVSIAKYDKRISLPPIYNSALALLDNNVLSVYHLNQQNVSRSVLEKVKNIFQRF